MYLEKRQVEIMSHNCWFFLYNEIKGLRKCLEHYPNDIEEVLHLSNMTTLEGKQDKDLAYNIFMECQAHCQNTINIGISSRFWCMGNNICTCMNREIFLCTFPIWNFIYPIGQSGKDLGNEIFSTLKTSISGSYF